MLATLLVEWTKFYRHRSAYLGFALLLGLVGLVGFAATKDVKHHEARLKRQMSESLGGEVVIAGKVMSAAFMPCAILAVRMPVYVFVASLVAMSSGGAIANEYSSGTLRTVLVRPLRRSVLVVAKWLVNAWHAVALTVFLGASSLAVGYLTLGAGDLVWFDMEGRHLLILPEMQAVKTLAVGYLLQGLGMVAVASIALLVSSFVSRGAVAAIVTLGFLLISGMVSAMPFEWFDVIKPYLLTTHMSRFNDVLAYSVDWRAIGVAALWVAGYALAALLGTLIIFGRREIRC